MATTKAIVVLPEGTAAVQNVPHPQVRDGWVLVRVTAVSLNPTDWKHIDHGTAEAGCRLGCDYAGIVETISPGVTKFKKGDRIAGAVHGGDRTNHENGAFAELIMAKAALAIQIPDNITDQEAATLGVSMLTIGQGLYKTMRLPRPGASAPGSTHIVAKAPTWILVHGGSTATALLGIQFAKLSGLAVVATASPSSFDTVRMANADVVFDYHSPECAADIKRHTGNELRYAWDCTGTGTQLCAAALSDKGPSMYVAINPVNDAVLKRINPLIDGPYVTLAYDAFGDEYMWLNDIVSPKADELEFASDFLQRGVKLLQEGLVRPVRTVVNRTGSGLEGALKGLNELRSGAVSGAKLVYSLSQ